jgi:hypothetical protein
MGATLSVIQQFDSAPKTSMTRNLLAPIAEARLGDGRSVPNVVAGMWDNG